MDFIKYLKRRKLHYSLKDNNEIYLSEDLNVSKLPYMYNQHHYNNKLHYVPMKTLIFRSDSLGRTHVAPTIYSDLVRSFQQKF